MEDTKIGWADHTHNEWIGCTKKQLEDGSLSEECRYCYAEDMMDKRFGKVKWGKGQDRVLTSESNRAKPHKWQKQAKASGKRLRIFCSSLSDVFDEEVPIEWLAHLLQTIHDTPDLDWLILTKRPENIMGDPLGESGFDGLLKKVIDFNGPGKMLAEFWWSGAPPLNVWLGTTAGTKASAAERIPQLLQVPAYVRFLSMEPLLDYIDLESFVKEDLSTYGFFAGGDPRKFTPDKESNSEEEFALHESACEAWDRGEKAKDGVGPPVIAGQLVKDDLSSKKTKSGVPYSEVSVDDIAEGDAEGKEILGGFIACGTSGLGVGVNHIEENGIHWVIVGGESGNGSRPMHPFWAWHLKEQCKELGIPFFLKQWGDWAPRNENLMADGRVLADHDPKAMLHSVEVDDGAGSMELMQLIKKEKAGHFLIDKEYLEFPAPTHHKSVEV